MSNNIVIIGAGYAGILTAKKLAKRLRKIKDVDIKIIDKNPFHTMLTELHEVAAARVDEDSIKLSLKKVFAGRNVQVITDTIQNIDFDNKSAIGSQEKYQYDYLVMAAGSRPTFFNIPGAEEYSYKLWSFNDAVVLRDHIRDCFRKAERETDSHEKRKLLTFFIAGAGFTGTETMGELAEYIPILCQEHEIDRSLVSLNIADALDRVVPTLTEKLSSKIEKRLKKSGVNLYLGSHVVKLGEDYIELSSNGEQLHIDTKTVIWATGTQSADITQKAAESLPSECRARLKTDKYLRSVADESVFVIGDNIFYIPEGEKTPVPQIVENCEQSADVAAHNIVHLISGEGEMMEYKPKFHGIMVSVGGRYGSALVGSSNHKFSLPSFLAMFAKHFINIIYFIQVLGWNKIISYIKHEFFTIRNNRSFVGGHFSNKTPSFLLVPLRLWFGAVWLFEGIKKVAEGWLSSPKLTGFFNGAQSWYESILNGAGDAASSATPAAAQAAEAVSSATPGTVEKAAEAVGQALINFNFLGLFRILFVSGKALADSTLSDLALKLDVPLMNWFIDKVILPYGWIQLAMQIFIVVAEILIGLSLIGGLFATPSSLFSLVLQFMFLCTTGLYLGNLWMVFAAVAMIFSGRVFGLDYYATPFLKRKWKKLGIVRRLYIYND